MGIGEMISLDVKSFASGPFFHGLFRLDSVEVAEEVVEGICAWSTHKKEEEPRGGSSIRGIGDGIEKLLDSDGGQRAVRCALDSGDFFLQVAPRQDAA